MKSKWSQALVFLIALTFMVLFSCEQKSEVIDTYLTNALVLGDSLNIDLPDTIPHLGSLVRPLYNTKNDLFSYGIEDGGKINIFSYQKDLTKWKLTVLDINGPNQVYGNGAFNFFDSEIVYLPYNSPKILRLNEKGIKISEMSYFDNRDMAFDSKVKNPIIHDDGDNIFFDLASYVSFSDPETFEKTKTVGKYSHENDEFYPIVNYPKEFYDKTWSGNDAEHQFVIRDGLIYMNFVKSEFVYVYDDEGNLLNQKPIKSDKIKNSEGNRYSDSMMNAMEQMNNGHYPKIVYDRWRDVFYRVGVYFDVGYEIKSMQDVGSAFMKKKVVIIAFDKDLNILASNEFDAVENRLNEYYHWVNEDGFFLYQAPKEVTENRYQFAKFSLTKLPLSSQ